MAIKPEAASFDRDTLRDFTADPRLLLLSLMAVLVGTLGAGSAWVLLRLIGLCTNIAYFQRVSGQTVHFAGTTLPLWTIVIPVVGGADRRPDGALRLGEDSRPRHPGGD
jgi:hypothetical protein